MIFVNTQFDIKGFHRCIYEESAYSTWKTRKKL